MNQKLNKIDKLDLSIIKHEYDLKQAKLELEKFENMTNTQIDAVKIEIEQHIFVLKTLKFITND
jgi:hypothetical protein